MYFELCLGVVNATILHEYGQARGYSVDTILSTKSLCILYTICDNLDPYVYRLVHAFTAAGVLPSQYKQMSTFAEVGTIGKQYINKGGLTDSGC